MDGPPRTWRRVSPRAIGRADARRFREPDHKLLPGLDGRGSAPPDHTDYYEMESGGGDQIGEGGNAGPCWEGHPIWTG